jgi:4-hydroxybenzoate polyprenyltransferase
MPSTTAPHGGATSRLKLFLALSRTPHGVLDMAMPVAVALLWLGHVPPPGVMLLGLFTVFAGYTAVYAVNDLADYKTDRANFLAGQGDTTGYLDAVYARHPMAMGLITPREGLIWAGGWAVAALAGAWALNPVCALMLLSGCALEVVYCLLLKVSHLRALLNGVVKTLGSVAAVLAVDGSAPWWFLGLVFAALFCWEIGGQNIPADWFDLELDRRQGAKTMCVVLGLTRAAKVSLAALFSATVLAALILALSPARIPAWLVLAATAANIWLTAWPARRLMTDPSRENASRLFGRASYFPMALLAVVVVWFVAR